LLTKPVAFVGGGGVGGVATEGLLATETVTVLLAAPCTPVLSTETR
jgi:ABC-type proline/glycine betaine transport system permease subunit